MIGRVVALLLASALAAHGQVPPIRGSLSASGYTPPAGMTVLWKCSDGRSFTKRLDPSARWDSVGDGAGHMARYAEGEMMTALGCYLPQARGEFVGGRQWPIATRLFELAGVPHRPPPSAVYDILLANFDAAPTCCDWLRLFREPDPIAGARCAGCSSGAPAPGNKRTPPPRDLEIDSGKLLFKWDGEPEPAVNFSVYEVPPAGEMSLLGAGRSSPIVLTRPPAAGGKIWVQARQRRMEPGDALLEIGGEPPAPPVDPPPPPPTCPLAALLGAANMDEVWAALTPEQRYHLAARGLANLLADRSTIP